MNCEQTDCTHSQVSLNQLRSGALLGMSDLTQDEISTPVAQKFQNATTSPPVATLIHAAATAVSSCVREVTSDSGFVEDRRPKEFASNSREFSRHAADCVLLLSVVNNFLIKEQRNFDTSVVRACLELLNRDFVKNASTMQMCNGWIQPTHCCQHSARNFSQSNINCAC